MLLNKQNLTIANLADSSESRYSLNSIQISQKGTAVTNGHYLVTVSLPTVLDSNFPVTPGFTPTNGSTPDFLLKRDDALEIMKALPKKTNYPIVQHAQVGAVEHVDSTLNQIQLAVNNLDSHRIFSPAKPEGSFPNIEAVIPDSADTKMTIAFSADYLMKLAKSAIDTCGKDAKIKLELRDPQHAIKMTARNSDTEQDWMAVLMPVRM